VLILCLIGALTLIAGGGGGLRLGRMGEMESMTRLAML
jgi:hypothetical protein